MKNIVLAISMVLFGTSYIFAQSAGYYDDATGTSYTLKTQLCSIISNGHTQNSYGSLHGHFETTDVDAYYENDGSVLDMYSENPDGSDPYNFAFASGDQCGNYSSEGDCYNREHSFPKSWFNDGYPMYADLFHLYPTDGKVNGYRSNFPFGETTSPTYTSQNGCKLGSSSYPGYSGTVFEPIDEFKGDFARTYFYMATRYENVVSGWSSPMLDGSSEQVYEDWALNMLIEWHTNDPVSQKEIDRNDAVEDIQHNRNPFIDHPEWVYTIWGGSPVIKPEPDNQPTSFAAILNGANQIDLSWIDATGTNLPDGYLIKANTTGSFTEPSDGTYPSTDGNLADGSAVVTVGYGSQSYSFTNLSGETTYYFKIWSYANSDSNVDFNLSSAPTGNATTQEAPVVINSEDFSSCPGTWSSVSVAGSADWECDATYFYASVNAYGADAASDDYLISPEINLDAYSAETFTFDSWTKYNDTYYPPIELLYTTNYTGDPAATTWESLNPIWSSDGSETWTSSGDVDLSGINGSSVYLAFRYTSSGTGGGSSSIWDIDNIFLMGYESGTKLTASPSVLSGFVYEVGSGPSTSQSFILSGSELDGSLVTLTAPANYEISLDNSTFTTTETVSYTAPILNNTTVYVRLNAGLSTATYNTENVTITDDGTASAISVSCSGQVTALPVPTITATPSSLTGYSYVEGSGPSSVQSFSLSGTDLDGASVSIAAPTNYEISLDNTTFSAAETVSYSGPTLTSTAVYVRLKAGLSAATYNNENIICSDNGSAATITVGNSGAVSSGGGVGSIIAIQDFDETTPVWSYSGSGSVDLSYGKTSNGYRIGETSEITLNSVNVSGYSSLKIYISDASVGGIENSDALNVYVNVDGAGFSATPDVTIQESNTSDDVYNATWDYSGSNTASTIAGTPIIVNGDGATGYANIEIGLPDGTSTVEVKIASNNNKATEYYYVDDIKIVGEAASSNPTFTVSPTTLTAFTYVEGSGPSSVQSFNLSGTDLDGSSVTITAPVHYEISLDNSTFTTTETVSYTAPTLSNTTVYVRLKAGLSAGTYNNENVTCADNGSAENVTVSNNGEVTAALNPVLTVSPSILNGYTCQEGSGSSVSQSFILSGSELDGSSVTITAPVNYEISLDNSTFTITETVSYTAPSLSNTTVYVRLKAGLSAGTYNNENVTCADNGSAASITVLNNGEVVAASDPLLIVSPATLGDYTYQEGLGPSTPQSFILSGSELDGSTITITAPANYEISLDNSTFATTETVSYIAPTLSNTTVYVRLIADLSAGIYNNENVTCADNGSAASAVVSNSGEVIATSDPLLIVSPTALNGYTYQEGSGPSISQSFILSGSELDGSTINITAPANYEISLDNSTFATSETVSYTAPTLSNTTVYVRLKAGLSAGIYNNENVTCADNGSAAIAVVSNSGEVIAASNPLLIVSPQTLNDFTYQEGFGASASQSFTLSGSELDGTSVEVLAPEFYEISLDNSTYSDLEMVTYSGSTLEATTIYVRMAADLDMGTYINKNVVCTDNGSARYEVVTLNGEVTAPLNPVPDDYPTNFIASAFDDAQINLTWIDATGTNLPTGYLLKASTSDSFTVPIHGVEPTGDNDLSDGEAVLLLPYGTITHSFTNLLQETTYYFSMWSYANSGENILYKTDGNVPNAMAITMGEGIFNSTDEGGLLNVYPNPSTDHLFIEVVGNVLIQIFNMQGQIQHTQQVQNSGSVDVSGFESGVYLIKAQRGDEISQKVVIIE